MGVGHAVAALGAVEAAPRANLGPLVSAAFLADFLLGIFALAGLEQIHFPVCRPLADSENSCGRASMTSWIRVSPSWRW
jgi:hypothetical protein